MIEHIDVTELLPARASFLKPQRIRQGDLQVTMRDGKPASARSFAYPFDFYHHREWIDDSQHQAGLQFAGYFAKGYGSSLHALMRYVSAASGPFDPMMATVNRQKFFLARQAIRGERERRLAFAVCCWGEKAGQGDGMRRLKSALDDLVKYFG